MSTLDRPCENWAERISAHLDGELADADDRAVREHLDDCPQCRRWAESAKADQERFAAAYGKAAEGADLRAKVVAAAGSGLPRARPWRLAGQVAAAAVLGLIAAVVLFPVFGKARQRARQAGCISNQKQIVYAVKMYADSSDGVLPPAIAWNAYLLPYLKGDVHDMFRCPGARRLGSPGYDYAYNPELAARREAEIPDPTCAVATFDAENGQVAPRHAGGAVFGFLDGHAKFERVAQTSKGWVVERHDPPIPIPFGAQAVPPDAYTVAREGAVVYEGSVGQERRWRDFRARAVFAGAIGVLLAGLLGWLLGRRRRPG